MYTVDVLQISMWVSIDDNILHYWVLACLSPLHAHTDCLLHKNVKPCIKYMLNLR